MELQLVDVRDEMLVDKRDEMLVGKTAAAMDEKSVDFWVVLSDCRKAAYLGAYSVMMSEMTAVVHLAVSMES